MNSIEKKRNSKKKEVVKTDTDFHKNASIDIIHEKKLKHFNELSVVVLPQKQAELVLLQQQNKVRSHLIDNKIRILKSEIEDILNKTEETDYFLAAMPILKDYYTLLESNEYKKTVKVFGKPQLGQTKKQLLTDQYLDVINDTGSGVIGAGASIKSLSINSHCPNCKSKDFVEDESLCCVNCGHVINNQIISTKMAYRDRENYTIEYATKYDRQTYFKETLFQIQGNELTVIPQEITDALYSELAKEKYTDLSKLTIDKVKSLLKKTGNSKWYEHTPYIIKHLNNKNLIKIPPLIQHKFFFMFDKIEKEFDKQKFRSNFFSYPYCCRKISELLELKEYYQFFPFLLDREKLHNQDMMWKVVINNIIEENLSKKDRFDIDWRYIKST